MRLYSGLLRTSATVLAFFVFATVGAGLSEESISYTWGTSGSYWSNNPGVIFERVLTNDNGKVEDSGFDPYDTGIDPGYEKAVAECVGYLKNSSTVKLKVYNGYPSYTCTFRVIIRNTGSTKLRNGQPDISAPSQLTVTDLNPTTCSILKPGKKLYATFTVHVEQHARQNASYQFSIEQRFTEAKGGTVGFWKDWSSHKTYSKSTIEGWLRDINASSNWLGPTTVSGMVSLLKGASGSSATPESRFLAQYLALRLNERAGIQCGSNLSDLADFDRNDYLALGASAEAASLSGVIQAIELKYGTTPGRSQFNMLKDVCEGLNGLEL